MSERIRELPGVFIHESAYVDAPCAIGEGTKVWHFAHVQAGARIGRGTRVYPDVFFWAPWNFSIFCLASLTASCSS